MAKSKIEWTDKTWNPLSGCNKISPGCKNCYAEKTAKRLQAMGTKNYRDGFKLTLHPHVLEYPLKWKTPQTIFVNSMSDLFHDDVPTSFIKEVFDVMNRAHWHRFQVLTKRSARLYAIADQLTWTENIWMGVSVESADYQFRIEHLRGTGAAIKWLSVEPLLGSIPNLNLKNIDWVVVGGESGPGARPMEADWVLDIRNQCIKTGVPFFFKQWGGVHKKKAGRLLEGREWNEMPTVGAGPSSVPPAPKKFSQQGHSETNTHACINNVNKKGEKMALVRKQRSKLEIIEIEISKIIVKRVGLRHKGEPKDLIKSIKEIGLISPLTVNENYELIAGGRRYAAVKALGFNKVPVTIYKSSSSEQPNLYEDLAHLDENLARLNLEGMAADDALAKRKQIYEQLHPETKRGGDRKSEKIKGQESSFDSFLVDTAKKTGQSKSAIKEAVRRSEKASNKLRAAREADTIGTTQATEIVKLDEKLQDDLVPHLENKTVAEVKQIIAKAQDIGVTETIREVNPMGSAIKLFVDLKAHGSKYRTVLEKIVTADLRFLGLERTEALQILADVEIQTNAFNALQREGTQ